MRTLVIPDAHVETDDDLRRFDALGRYIVEAQPDNIVQIGDFITLDSLSNWDRNKRLKMEGRRFAIELDHARDAVHRIMEPIVNYNKHRTNIKAKQYKPHLVALDGNHEDRFYRYIDVNAELAGIIDLSKELGWSEYGWIRVPYREYYDIRGIQFTHAPMNNVNQPLGGVYVAHRAAVAHAKPVVFGHTHRLLVGSYTPHGEGVKQIQTINVGCFFEDVPDYAKGSLGSRDWWRGVVELSHYGECEVDISTYRLEAMLHDFGGWF